MNPDPFLIETFDTAPDALLQAVDQALDAHNHPVAAAQGRTRLPCHCPRRVRGGAVGRAWGACCEPLRLWVSEDQRFQGLGTTPVTLFEQSARSLGCTVFCLTTLGYQAPDFDRKQC